MHRAEMSTSGTDDFPVDDTYATSFLAGFVGLPIDIVGGVKFAFLAMDISIVAG